MLTRFDASALCSGAEIVVEEFLAGEEASFFALIDGETCVALASAQDHKAVGEGDTGGPPRLLSTVSRRHEAAHVQHAARHACCRHRSSAG